MSNQRFNVGSEPRVRATFRDRDGNLVTPTLVQARWVQPDGTDGPILELGVDPEMGEESTGVVYVDVPLTQGSDSDPWWVKFKSEDPDVGSDDFPLWVRVPKVTF